MRVALLLFLAACGAGSAPAGPDADPSTEPVVVMSTSMGDLVVRLEPDAMPVTTANFLAYVDAGWYDGTIIHRVVSDWVIQGGGYTSGLVEKTAMAPIPLETSPDVLHVDGTISMARTSDPDSATSQWFLCTWPHDSAPPQSQLDGSYAAFGHLIEGTDVLHTIAAVPTTTSGTLQDVPVTEITVTSVRRR